MRWRAIGLLLGLSLVMCIPAWASDYLLPVGPPSGGDDTAVLQAALDDCMTNHPTGCTIQLSAGTYKSTQLLAESFHGSLRGVGMDATIIQALPLVEVTAGTVGEGYFDTNPPSRTNRYPFLIIFMAGDIKVSDMTFEVTDYDPVSPWCYSGLGCGQTYLYGFLGVIGTSAKLVIERVGFQGGPGRLPTGRNYDNGPFFLGLSIDQPLTGTFKVLSSRIRNGEDSLLVWDVRGAEIIIGGSPSDGNVIEPGALGGAFIDLEDSVFEYAYNNVAVDPWAGLLVWQGDLFLPQNPSQFLIQHNTFNVMGSYVDGIWPIDAGPVVGWGKTADFVIRDNTIQIAGSEVDPAWAGIEALGLDEAIILNNRIVGYSTLGISLEGATNCLVKGNNIQKVDADLASLGLLSYNIGTAEEPILVPTSDSTVVGFGNKTNVYDEGVNNTFVGVNNMQGNPPGPAVRDAIKRKMEMIKSMRKP